MIARSLNTCCKVSTWSVFFPPKFSVSQIFFFYSWHHFYLPFLLIIVECFSLGLLFSKNQCQALSPKLWTNEHSHSHCFCCAGEQAGAARCVASWDRVHRTAVGGLVGRDEQWGWHLLLSISSEPGLGRGLHHLIAHHHPVVLQEMLLLAFQREEWTHSRPQDWQVKNTVVNTTAGPGAAYQLQFLCPVFWFCSGAWDMC